MIGHNIAKYIIIITLYLFFFSGTRTLVERRRSLLVKPWHVVTSRNKDNNSITCLLTFGTTTG